MLKAMELFDSHCHLQDPRILNQAPQLIATALQIGVVYFAVNGISEKDWHVVKKMGDQYPSVIPCFGLHPWFIGDRTPNWFGILKQFFKNNPCAAVGEIGLDRSPLANHTDYAAQVEVFRKQLELAKELNRPASVHCIDAFEDLLDIMKSIGPFPAGVILHSYIGSAEIVDELAKLGAYFSFSGWIMPVEVEKAKLVLKAVPSDRILLETDAPDGLPIANSIVDCDLFVVDGDDPSKPTRNHPANIRIVLSYVASLLDMKKEQLAEISYRNAVRLFSYRGSKVSEK